MALQGVHVFKKHGNTVIVKFLYIDDTIAVTVRGPTPNKDRTKFLNLFTHTVHVKFRSCASVMRQDGGRVGPGDGDTALSVHRRTSLRNVVDDDDDV